MKQILQNLKTGRTELVEIPAPQAKPGHLLIKTTHTLISAGTERMLVEFSRGNYLQKAKQQPEKVRQVLEKIKTDGLLPTIDAVRAKLDQPLALGYCHVGTVLECQASNFQERLLKGERVISNGPHAEVVCVPRNLCVRIPNHVSEEDASFTVVSAIGLQGIRLANPSVGETFVVIGLGLIGLLTVQMLHAAGCQVLGVDIDPAKGLLAQKFGATVVDLSLGGDPLAAVLSCSGGRGADGVLITAATTSSEPVHQAAQMCRKRGRIVLVGMAGLELKRSDLYEKELSFQVSCSYGPGRYDPEYEEKGHDYPIGYVRWTAQRNFEAVLDLMASGKLDVKSLISHRLPFEEAEKAYKLIGENTEPYTGILLQYQSDKASQTSSLLVEKTIELRAPSRPCAANTSIVAGVIGSGNFAGQVLLPALQQTGARLKTIASSKGVTGTHLGKKFGFERSTTDVERIFADAEITTVFITTRHNTHAQFVLQALEAGKHVFVEKPLCLTLEELDSITSQLLNFSTSPPLLMVGFNRRFAPHIVKLKTLLSTIYEPKSFILTVNAGSLPPEHWNHDPHIGGGRILGEACHFIDLLRFLAGHHFGHYSLIRLNKKGEETVSLQFTFADGSIGTIHYFTNGNKGFSKEHLEVFGAGKILQLDNFKTLRGYGWKTFHQMKLWRQDKGHHQEMQRFIEAIEQGGAAPIPFEEIVEVMRVTLELSSECK
ncbi:oxidoreductase domain protein [Candidatus Vecturithrix granuli]|uniref:Oxidoreductase domain protein n=1 Tax=Vecturithrix granuli TaxID=1499967 RepID=A0A081BXU2_VECG1|nr:oxidoreductase domain protein [Candidatus Vecturithrix granuli]